MHEGGRLQSVVPAFLAEVGRSELTQFLIYERCEFIDSLLITLGPLGQESRHFMSGWNAHLAER